VARVKSRCLLEALDRRRDLKWQNQPELVDGWNNIRRELGAMLKTIESSRGEHARYSVSVYKKRISELSVQMRDMEIEIARSEPRLGAVLGYLHSPPLREVLNSDELYVELFFTGSDLIVFMLSKAGLKVSFKTGAREVVESLVESVSFQLSKAAYGRQHLEKSGSFLVQQIRSKLAKLGETILGELEGRSKPKYIYVAPHGTLHHLPFAALELGGQALVDFCSVAVVPGSGVLRNLLEKKSERPKRLGIAGAAPPGLDEIPREVSEIARCYKGAKTVPSANCSDVRDLLETCDTVHVASHGAFQPMFPGASGILLEDGWLTALDLLQIPIRATLVSFGACSTGTVALSPGEELSGVVRALMIAGVKTAILAPGTLDDTVARLSAQVFYERLTELGPGQALRSTLKDLKKEYPHPALWAGLQLYGNPRSWKDRS